MIRKLLIYLTACCAPWLLTGQTQQEERIAITPMVCDALDLPPDARAALNQKLLQMTVQNGFGATGGSFILTADIRTVDKQVTATAPAQYIVELEVSVYVVNLQEQLLAAETSFVVKSIESSEHKAMIRAINRINARTPVVRQFMTSAREKIVDYYATRIPMIVAKAQSLADRDDYEAALAALAAVPESLDDYPMVAEKMTAVYTQMVDKFATVSIQEAKSKIALRDYEGALDALLYVDPSSTRFEEAARMVDSIKGTIDAREQAEMQVRLNQMEAQRELALKMHDDEVMLRRMQIEASQKTAEKRASGSDAATQSALKNWLFGKLN